MTLPHQPINNWLYNSNFLEKIMFLDKRNFTLKEVIYSCSQTEEKKGRKSLPTRQSQGGSRPVGRFLSLLRYGTIRADVLEAYISIDLGGKTERIRAWEQMHCTFKNIVSLSLWLCFLPYNIK